MTATACRETVRVTDPNWGDAAAEVILLWDEPTADQPHTTDYAVHLDGHTGSLRMGARDGRAVWVAEFSPTGEEGTFEGRNAALAFLVDLDADMAEARRQRRLEDRLWELAAEVEALAQARGVPAAQVAGELAGAVAHRQRGGYVPGP